MWVNVRGLTSFLPLLQVSGPHLKGEHGSVFQDQAPQSSVPAGSLSSRGALRLRAGGRMLLRPQPHRAEGLDAAARAR